MNFNDLTILQNVMKLILLPLCRHKHRRPQENNSITLSSIGGKLLAAHFNDVMNLKDNEINMHH